MNIDVKIQRHVIEELDWEPCVDAARIGVTVENGMARLAGHAVAYAEKVAAEEAAKRVQGVKGVVNELVVEPLEGHGRHDGDIAAAAIHAIEWNVGVPHDRVRVSVSNGWITMAGTVGGYHYKTAAEQAVRHLAGVRGVTNDIDVAMDADFAGIQDSIATALRRSAALNTRDISVETEDDRTVILCGDVHSHVERQEAERIAWTARGVAKVENCITVTPFGSGPADEWGY